MSAQPAPRRTGRPVKLFAAWGVVPSETRTMAAFLRLDADAAEALATCLRAQARAKRELAKHIERPTSRAPVEREQDTCGIAVAARRTGISVRRLRQLVVTGVLPALRDGDGALIQPCRVRLADIEALISTD